MNETDINRECANYIEGIGNMGLILSDDCESADSHGLRDHKFNEDDLKLLKELYEQLEKVFDSMPDFDYIITHNKPVGCKSVFLPDSYPCNECRYNREFCCTNTGEWAK